MLVAVCCSVLVYLFFNKFIRSPTGLRAGVLPPRFCDTTETRGRPAFSVCGGRETASLHLRSVGLNEFQSHFFRLISQIAKDLNLFRTPKTQMTQLTLIPFSIFSRKPRIPHLSWRAENRPELQAAMARPADEAAKWRIRVDRIQVTWPTVVFVGLKWWFSVFEISVVWFAFCFLLVGCCLDFPCDNTVVFNHLDWDDVGWGGMQLVIYIWLFHCLIPTTTTAMIHGGWAKDPESLTSPLREETSLFQWTGLLILADSWW